MRSNIIRHILTLLTLGILGASVAEAQPYYAVREGYACTVCHINRSGGGMRNAFGVHYSQNMLPMETMAVSSTNGSTPVFVDSALSAFTSIGGNLRLDNVTIFHEESVHRGETVERLKTQNSFSIPEGNLYLQMKLLGDRLSFYLDQNVSPVVGSREAFFLWQALESGLYIKGGKILQPYGIRLLDDQAATRSETGYRYNTPAQGVEAGIDNGLWHASVAVTNGREGTVDKKTSGLVYALWETFRIGVSASYLDNTTPTENRQEVMTGLFAGFRIGPITWLGEADQLKQQGTASKRTQYVGFTEINWLVTQGLNVKGAFDYHNPSDKVSEDDRSRVVLGVEYFPVPFFQLSLYGDKRWDIPQAAAADKADRVLVQAHVYY